MLFFFATSGVWGEVMRQHATPGYLVYRAWPYKELFKRRGLSVMCIGHRKLRGLLK